MKKLLGFALGLCMVLSTTLTAFAADQTTISLVSENIGRGQATAVVNSDGSVLTKKDNISFYLPETIASGKTVTVNIKGKSDGDFRVWLIDTNETTNSNIYKASENGFTSGSFDVAIEFTTVGDATELFFKSPSWDATLNNLTISSITIAEGAAPVEEVTDTTVDEAAVEEDDVVVVEDDADVVEDDADVEEDDADVEEDDTDVVEDTVDDAEEATDEVDEVVEKTEAKATNTTLPKTGVVSTTIIFGLGAAAFGTGATLLKKKEN